MQGDSRSKSFGIASLMKNHKTRKVLLDAWDAPVGSTKRAKAKSLLKSVNSAGRNFNYSMDGQGGPGPGMPDPLAPSSASTYTKPGASSPSPDLSVTGGTEPPLMEAVPPSTTKTQFIPSVDHMLKPQPDELAPLAPSDSAPSTTYSLKWTPSGYEPVAADGSSYSVTGPKPKFDPNSPTGEAYSPTEGYAPSDATETPFGSNSPFSNLPYPRNSADQGTSDPANGGTSGDPTNQDATDANKPTGSRAKLINDALDAQGKKINSQDEANRLYQMWIDKGVDEKEAFLQIFDLTKFAPYVEGAYGNDQLTPAVLLAMSKKELDIWYRNLPAGEQANNKLIYESIRDGKGVNYYKYHAWKDRAALAAALDMPIEELANHPESGLLSEHLSDLMDSTKDKYRIDEQLDNIMNKTLQGLTIQEDLRSYVRGKDEYLGEIERLQDETQTRMANMDMSNPEVRKRMNNYSNYLAILHGRQNQRYIGYLNTSVAYHTAERERLQLSYDSSIKLAQEDYEKKSAMTIEDHEKIDSILEDSYANLEKMDENSEASLDLSVKRITALGKNADVMMNLAKMKQDNPGLDLADLKLNETEAATVNKIVSDVEGGITTDGKEDKDYDALDEDEIYGSAFDKDGVPTTFDPIEMSRRNSLTGKKGQDPAESERIFFEGASKYIKDTVGSSGDPTKATKGYNAYLLKRSNEILSMPLTTEEEVTAAREASDSFDRYRDNMIDATTSGLQEYFLSSDNNITEMKDAIFRVTGAKWSQGRMKDEATFLATDEAKALDGDLAKRLYVYYEVNDGPNSSSTRNDMIAAAEGPDEDLAMWISTELVPKKSTSTVEEEEVATE